MKESPRGTIGNRNRAHLEVERGVSRDFGRGAVGAIGIIRLAGKYGLLAFQHGRDADIPAFDHTACSRRYAVTQGQGAS